MQTHFAAAGVGIYLLRISQIGDIRRKNFSSCYSATASLFISRFIFNGLRNGQLRLSDCLTTFGQYHPSHGMAQLHRHTGAEVIMGSDEQFSYIMLFCALLLVKNSKATMEQSLSIVPFAGPAKSLFGELFSKDSGRS